jgi:hypothetical protein
MLGAMWLGVATVATKFLSLLFAPIFFLHSNRRAVWTLCFAALPLVGYGTIWIGGGNPLKQVAFQAFDLSSGNLPYLLTITGIDLKNPISSLACNLASFALLASIFLAVFLRSGPRTARSLVLACGWVLILLMIVSKKSFADYLVIGLFPVCLGVAANLSRISAAFALCAVSAVAVVEQSLWFRWLNQGSLHLLFAPQLPPGVTRLNLEIFFAFELAVVAGYVWIFVILMSSLRASSSDAHRSTGGTRAAATAISGAR